MYVRSEDNGIKLFREEAMYSSAETEGAVIVYNVMCVAGCGMRVAL